jgi:hypothetical protein
MECVDNELSPQLLQLELENIRSQLLRDFSPDEMCPTSAHYLESPGKIARPSSDDDTDYQEVYVYHLYICLTFFSILKVHGNFVQAELIDLRNDNITFAEVSATTLTDTAIPVPTTNLLSIDELLETVCSFFLRVTVHCTTPLSLFVHTAICVHITGRD